MHIANVKVPSEWVKLEDLLTVGRTKFEISKAETYFIHNNSGYVLYLAEASMLPIEEPQEIKIYPGKSAGYVKDVMDLYVCSKLPEGFPYPESLSITFSNDVGSNDAIAVGDYRPDSAFRGAYVYRGTVETVADLPQDAGVGDVYDVREEGGTNYAWNGESWDHIGGIEDLRHREISTVKVPKIVFNDDPERILRLIRFACALGLTIPEEEMFYAKQNEYKIIQAKKEQLEKELRDL